MREFPDLQAEAQVYFDSLKNMLCENAAKGQQFSPLFMYVTLTPDAMVTLDKPGTIFLVPEWNSDLTKNLCLDNIVTFLNRFASFCILCGSGVGTLADFEADVSFLFATVFAPGFKPWTLVQVYTVLEKEVVFGVQFNSSQHEVAHFDLPGLWPEENII